MKRVFLNKWFVLASLLTISLSAYSFLAHQDVDAPGKQQCCSKMPVNTDNSDLIMDLLSPHLPSVSFH